MTYTPGLGHNMPPVIDAFNMALDDAYSTAKDFLDGKPIETQGQADAVGRIVGEVKKLKKDADAARKKEKEPHYLASLAVDAKWKPLAERADTILAAAQKPLTAYLNKLADEQRELERIAREESATKAQEAIEAARALATGNWGVEALERVEQLEAEADAAAKSAAHAAKAKPLVEGCGRRIGLRKSQVALVTDRKALLIWIANNDEAALTAFLDEYARKSLPAQLPGVTIRTDHRI
jgi:hypothetical protein